MNDQMREGFESWYNAELKSVEEKMPEFCISAMRFSKEVLWQGWQASREALVIELPPIWEESPNTALGQACAQIRTADIEAIKAAGLKVANQ